MASNAERQRKFRMRKDESGFVSVTIFVPYEHVPSVRLAAKALCEDSSLELGPLRNSFTGKLVRRR